MGVGESSKGELLLELSMQPDGDGFLIVFPNFLWVVEERNAFTKLQGEEKWVADLVSDVWRREIVN